MAIKAKQSWLSGLEETEKKYKKKTKTYSLAAYVFGSESFGSAIWYHALDMLSLLATRI